MQKAVQPQSPQPPSVAPTETKREIALERWQSQKDFYSKRVGKYKRWHLGLQLYMGVIAVAVPILLNIPYVPLLISTMRTFRTTSETLNREKVLYDVGADVYKDLSVDDAATLFATRTEDILRTEWIGYFPSDQQQPSQTKQ
ncbi:MAG: hypothetical protein E6I80_16265 [Chloroflexi bacterium]|nr:MAG: hypothetical protein E6I80_16265 [Chloroflexota bacterium]